MCCVEHIGKCRSHSSLLGTLALARALVLLGLLVGQVLEVQETRHRGNRCTSTLARTGTFHSQHRCAGNMATWMGSKQCAARRSSHWSHWSRWSGSCPPPELPERAHSAHWGLMLHRAPGQYSPSHNSPLGCKGRCHNPRSQPGTL